MKISKNCTRDYKFYKDNAFFRTNFHIVIPIYKEKGISAIELYFKTESGIRCEYSTREVEEFMLVQRSCKCFMLQMLMRAEGGFITKEERYTILHSRNAPEWCYNYSDKLIEKHFINNIK